MTVQEGDTAPDFTLPATGGHTVQLHALRGRPVILYFYPKANTSGCTQQACDFQERLPALTGAGVALIGVSRDPMRPIERFAEKYGLTFPLCSDPEGAVATEWGCYVEKSMYGRKYMGIERSTFLIDKDGRVAKLWRKVKIDGHAAELLAAIKAL